MRCPSAHRLHHWYGATRRTPLLDCVAVAMQADAVKEISDFVARLRRVGKGLGVYEFDKFLAEKAAEMYAGIPSPIETAA